MCTFSRKYTYDLTVTDTSAVAIGNVSINLKDLKGNLVFEDLTSGSGTINTQTFTYGTYSSSSGNAITEIGPFTLKLKYYGKNFVEALKTLSAKTVETTQLATNSFVTLTSINASNQSGIVYTPPSAVSYGDETHTDFTSYGKLNNSPVTQSEFFVLFANGTKIYSGTDYTINYSSGNLTFTASRKNDNIIPVYSYGGKIMVTGSKTLSNIYDFIQGNLSDVFTTGTGSIYTPYVDVILGNTTHVGIINETTSKTLNFEDGFGFSAEIGTGSTINIDSSTWNFVWSGNTNGTFYRKYTYDATIKDTSGNTLGNTTIELLDVYGNSIFSKLTDANGVIPPQIFTLYTYEESRRSSETDQGPHKLYLKKYGYKFVETQKVFTGKTSE